MKELQKQTQRADVVLPMDTNKLLYVPSLRLSDTLANCNKGNTIKKGEKNLQADEQGFWQSQTNSQF